MADEKHERSAAGIDVTVPSVARIYDYLLGGKDNFAVDRELAEAILRREPEPGRSRWPTGVSSAVRWSFSPGPGSGSSLIWEPGCRVRTMCTRSRSGCVPMRGWCTSTTIRSCCNHAEALLARDESTVVICEDMREPERILAHPDVQRMIDFSQPVAVLFVAVLHFVTDEQDPWGIVSTMTEPLVPGSYLALSHVTLDGPPADVVADIQERYKNASAPVGVPQPRGHHPVLRRVRAGRPGPGAPHRVALRRGGTRPARWRVGAGRSGPQAVDAAGRDGSLHLSDETTAGEADPLPFGSSWTGR